jgi:hypothetical protein
MSTGQLMTAQTQGNRITAEDWIRLFYNKIYGDQCVHLSDQLEEHQSVVNLYQLASKLSRQTKSSYDVQKYLCLQQRQVRESQRWLSL